jgi:asparagine synthetase B (glutamine-hydrolysing)
MPGISGIRDPPLATLRIAPANRLLLTRGIARVRPVASRDFRPETREAHLSALVDRMGGVLVAFSGGVDSSYLLAVAVERLGVGRVRP